MILNTVEITASHAVHFTGHWPDYGKIRVQAGGCSDKYIRAPPINSEDRMHPVSHVVDEPSPTSFEATMRITLGGGTLERANQADTALVASILSLLNYKGER